NRRSSAPGVTDRLAPMRVGKGPAMRQRLPLSQGIAGADGSSCFEGEISSFIRAKNDPDRSKMPRRASVLARKFADKVARFSGGSSRLWQSIQRAANLRCACG